MTTTLQKAVMTNLENGKLLPSNIYCKAYFTNMLTATGLKNIKIYNIFPLELEGTNLLLQSGSLAAPSNLSAKRNWCYDIRGLCRCFGKV